jgi:hypothetical protein
MILTDLAWAEQTATAACLPDKRLKNRLARILFDSLQRPSASIPQTAGDAYQAKGTYRFYSNPRVTAPALCRGFAAETARECLEHETVLAVQDTTTLNFTSLDSIPELGPIDSGGLARGVHLHTTLAVTPAGRVIGPLDQQYWARPQLGKPGPGQKESNKWIHGLDAARTALHEAAEGGAVPRLIHVMDREGDAYEVMMAVMDAGDSAIIRCVQNRRIAGPLAKAHEAVRSQPVLCTAAVPVNRQPGAPARQAVVQVRSMSVELIPDLAKYPYAWTMTWNLVELWEPAPPAGTESVHWLIWTLEPAETADEALEVARKYTGRWPIEEVHLVLKSGCQVEALQLERWDRLEKAVTVNAALAARIVSLRDLARESPEAPAIRVLDTDEVCALVAHFGGEMKPSELTIGQAVLWIGRLGGHLNRKRDGMPGVRTLWRGMHDLTLLVAGFRAARNLRE